MSCTDSERRGSVSSAPKARVGILAAIDAGGLAVPSERRRRRRKRGGVDDIALRFLFLHFWVKGASFGLPRGLLPSSVTSYSMSANGDFVVKLAAPCYIQFTDLVFYDRIIRGRLSYGSITDLSGIQVKKVFVWLSLTGISADKDGKAIEFQVGFLSQKLPVSMFADIPTCRNKAAGGAACHDGEPGATVAVEAA